MSARGRSGKRPLSMVVPEPLTFADHEGRWCDCRRCDLHLTRKRVVLYRGDLPCDVLFIGEAPGRSEDVLGYPFAGPAGALLDQIIDRAWKCVGWAYRRGFTNLIACIPLDATDGKKTGEPLPEDVAACSERLVQVVRMADPRLLVLVGACAAHYTEPGKKKGVRLHREDLPRLEIVHPAAILRSNVAQQGFMIQKCVVQLRNAAEQLDAWGEVS